MKKDEQSTRLYRSVAAEQLLYARILGILSKAGLAWLVVTFTLYAGGFRPPVIPLEDLPRYWSLSREEYLGAAGIDAGWSWLRLIGHGDFLTFTAVAFLALTTLICYAAVIPSYLRKGDRIYGSLALIEVAVLAMAASGILMAGGR
ncbi:MAG: hypothetical protein AB1558_11445 [Thermodesulfobacteriota bacterium]